MDLFQIEKNQIIPKPHTLLVKEFKNIWDRDKSKTKEVAIQELAYIFYIADYKSVYLSTTPEERESVIKEDLLLKDNWKPDELVLSGIRRYEELQITPTLRYLDSQLKALEQLIGFFNTLDLTKTDKMGKAIYKPKEITMAMAEAPKVAEAIEKLKEKVKKEEVELGKVMGGGVAGYYEDIDN